MYEEITISKRDYFMQTREKITEIYKSTQPDMTGSTATINPRKLKAFEDPLGE